MVEPPILSYWNVSDGYDYTKAGRDSILYFCTDPEYGNIVVKTQKDVNQIFFELRVFKELLNVPRSPHICYPLFVNNTECKALVFPYSGTPLGKIPRGTLSPQQFVTIFIDIASALETVHSVGVIYFDLHDMNILVTESNRGMLIDFDSSELSTEVKLPLGNNEYFERYPPEAWTNDYTQTLDIYCYGHLLDRFLPQLSALSKKCMNDDPQKRPSLKYIKETLQSVELF